MRDVKTWLLYGLAGLVALLLAGTAYQWLGAWRDRQSLAPPGELVDVDGSLQHVDCRGDGDVTVVLLAGGGNSSLAWSLVAPELGDEARVCAVDRAGFGWSKPVSGTPTIDTYAAVARRALAEAGVSPPFILVGHSLGGMEAQLVADRHSDEVAGLVLVDSAHPAFFAEFPEFIGAGAGFVQVARAASRVGLVRLLVALDMAGLPDWWDELPPETRQAFAAEYARPSHWDAAAAMNEGLEQSLDELGQRGTLPPLPLIVIAHGIDDMFAELDAQAAERGAEVWRSLQAQLAAESAQGSLWIAEESGHMIPLEQPELVVEAVGTVLEMVGADD